MHRKSEDFLKSKSPVQNLGTKFLKKLEDFSLKGDFSLGIL